MMRFSRTESFKRSYKKLPKFIQRKTDRILIALSADLRHPSIRAKKIQGTKAIWEGRVDRFYRFTFEIKDDELVLRSIGRHEITKRES